MTKFLVNLLCGKGTALASELVHGLYTSGSQFLALSAELTTSLSAVAARLAAVDRQIMQT